MQRIVVGVDGSATSRAALRWAAGMAARLGAGIEVVRAWHYPPSLTEWEALPSNYGYLPVLPEYDDAERFAEDDLAAVTAEVLGTEPAVPVDQRVIQGHPADVLVAESGGALLLVVGRRGHSRLVELMLGSVARACTERARCPVVVVPAGGDEAATHDHVAAAAPAE